MATIRKINLLVTSWWTMRMRETRTRTRVRDHGGRQVLFLLVTSLGLVTFQFQSKSNFMAAAQVTQAQAMSILVPGLPGPWSGPGPAPVIVPVPVPVPGTRVQYHDQGHPVIQRRQRSRHYFRRRNRSNSNSNTNFNVNYNTNSNLFDVSILRDYFKNNRLVDFQSKCLFMNYPCDIVGRWIKPRLSHGLLGFCEDCSVSQTETLLQIIEILRENRPDVYEKAVKTYLNHDQLLTFVMQQTQNQNRIMRGSTEDDGSHFKLGSGLDSSDSSLGIESSTGASLPQKQENSLRNQSDSSKNQVFKVVVDNNLVLLEDFDLFTTPKSSRSFSFPILSKKSNSNSNSGSPRI